ncbi:ABC transporter substrate-binding protein [Pacificitalea manganoxidans]|uniref:ABC transporter substrate-binding protein n=1 Tax=Pacificitalea manganoxidans TaxID=1411902 RepID=A0A291LV99_9RHOB|nr:tripartite tricarboxylate transporter substrate binding protein [Pacificitalea manganoxidans]ATI40622.1 ABC transporter substrate-binding protein [Pacificitalea manganoxidans]MBF52435.1 tripartite tricarboxylate transporter substrate binding protein [Actibacterium sp.]MDR6309609.1 tripartite-type tricarboxylate transporter receptor subunit TctC [Pacificitalea manganoxidans]OWU69738.1 ABC transporter substrate-binding protein [Roseovarius sp. 22II1-1F6A]|tara:strand:+ start:48 stop:1013 length:966 start_codon:yes stop_codon:yes gene_type:complete
MFSKGLKSTIALALGACIMGTSVAAAEFPTRDIRLIVPWPAGGGADAISRKISNIAEQELPKSIYVENIAGAVTATGLIQMTSSRPDGHTVGVLTYDSVITLPRGQMVPGYSLDNMTPIARITSEADAIVVSKHSGINTFEELVEKAKANPGQVRVGVAPKGSGPYLSASQLEKLLDVDFNVITYAGSSSAEAEALLSGELDAAISSLGDFSGIIESGDAKGVVELTSVQNMTYTDVPTISDKGYDLQTGSFIILAAPANTPDEAITTLETAFKTAYDSEEFQSWLQQVGVTADWLGSDEVVDWMGELQEKTFSLMDELDL